MRLRRKPPKGNVRRVTSIDRNLRGVFTNKAGHPVQIESFEERILTLQFERDRSVKDYRSQPLTITFTDQDKRERKYTPDFAVWRNNNAIEIHEVTITERRKLAHSREREKEAKKVCKKKGWRYVVHTEHTLPQETEVANLLALLPYRLMKYAHEGVDAALREHLSRTISDSLSGCSKGIAQRLGLAESTVFGAICHLLWTEEISADLRSVLLIIDCAFNPAVKVWLPERKGKDQ
jgi:TnsA endonuclease N terminal